VGIFVALTSVVVSVYILNKIHASSTEIQVLLRFFSPKLNLLLKKKSNLLYIVLLHGRVEVGQFSFFLQKLLRQFFISRKYCKWKLLVQKKPFLKPINILQSVSHNI